MANVHFEDNSVQVIAALGQASIAFLHEVTNELKSQTQRNTAVGKVNGSDTKNSWEATVDEDKLVGTVGNPKENAIWEEFGTGEYALNGKGRKGGWYIPIGYGEGEISPEVVEAYHFRVYEKDGKRFAYTKGKKPKRALQKAFNKNRSKIKKRAESVFKEYMND